MVLYFRSVGSLFTVESECGLWILNCSWGKPQTTWWDSSWCYQFPASVGCPTPPCQSPSTSPALPLQHFPLLPPYVTYLPRPLQCRECCHLDWYLLGAWIMAPSSCIQHIASFHFSWALFQLEATQAFKIFADSHNCTVLLLLCYWSASQITIFCK